MDWAENKSNLKWQAKCLENGSFKYKMPEEVLQRGVLPDHDLTVKEIDLIRRHQREKDAYNVK